MKNPYFNIKQLWLLRAFLFPDAIELTNHVTSSDLLDSSFFIYSPVDNTDLSEICLTSVSDILVESEIPIMKA